MTNKIRNLFKRLKKNKRSADDQDDITGEVYFEGEESSEDQGPEEMATPEELMAQGELEAEEFEDEEFEAEEFDEDSTGTYEEYDLDQPPSFKERILEKTGTFSRKLKDQLNKIDTRKFKTPKFESGSKTLSNIKIPKGLNSSKLKNFHVEIFDPKRKNAIHKAFQYAIIFGTVFVAGKNLALLLKGTDAGQGLDKSTAAAPIEDKLLTQADANKIKNTGLFKTEAAKPVDQNKKPVIAQNIKCEKADKKSRLPIKLLNTVVLQDSVKSIASVQVRSELSEIREGDKINDMAKVDLIGRQKIIVKNLRDGACEVIENDLEEGAPRRNRISVMSPSQSKAFKSAKKPEGIQNDGNNYTIEKSFIQDKMKNISDVLTQARGIQMTNPDGTLSFKIVDVEPGGIFSYLGIQNNDVITRINGKKISNLNEVMGLFGGIKNLDKMNITVNRNGEEVPLKYNIQ